MVVQFSNNDHVEHCSRPAAISQAGWISHLTRHCAVSIPITYQCSTSLSSDGRQTQSMAGSTDSWHRRRSQRPPDWLCVAPGLARRAVHASRDCVYAEVKRLLTGKRWRGLALRLPLPTMLAGLRLAISIESRASCSADVTGTGATRPQGRSAAGVPAWRWGGRRDSPRPACCNARLSCHHRQLPPAASARALRAAAAAMDHAPPAALPDFAPAMPSTVGTDASSSSAAGTAPTTPAVPDASLAALASADGEPLHCSLRRNQACLSCRRRKLKCDARRPVCGTCARSRDAAALSHYASPVPLGDCVYPDLEPLGRDGADDSLPPAFRNTTASRPERKRNLPAANAAVHASSPPPRSRKKGRKTEDQPDMPSSEQLLACVHRLEALLAESQKTIQSHQAAPMPRADATMPAAGAIPGASAHFHHLLQGTAAPDVAAGMGTNNLGLLPNAGQRCGPVLFNPQDANYLLQASGGLSSSHNPPLISWTGNGFDRLMSFSNHPHPIAAWGLLNGAPAINGATGTAAAPHPGPAVGASSRAPPFMPSSDDYSALTDMMMSHLPLPGSLPNPIPPLEPSLPGTNSHRNPRPTAPGDPLVQLLWPEWPSNLPPPDTVFGLVDVFFDRHPLRVMFEADEFKHRLNSPADTSQFPDRGLIHTIIAAAAPLSDLFLPGATPPPMSIGGRIEQVDADVDAHAEGQNWLGLGPLHPVGSNPTGSSSLAFSDYHLRLAQTHVSKALTMARAVKGDSPIEWMQSLIIVSDMLFGRARVVECFLLCGLLCKALAPCGLLKLQPYSITGSTPIPGCFVPPPRSPQDEQTRRITFWCAYMSEAWHSNSGFFWASTINDESIDTSLPSKSSSEQGDASTQPQTLATPDDELFSKGHTDDFTLHVKAVVLFKRVRALLSVPKPSSVPTSAFSERSRALDKAIYTFLTTCPHPTNAAASMDLLCARLVALGALAILHQPFVNYGEPLSYPYKQVEKVIGETVEHVDLIRTSQFDPGHLPTRTLFTFMVRTVVLIALRKLTYGLLQTSAKLLAEHISHLRHSGINTPAAQALSSQLRSAFDKIVMLLKDMNSTGVHSAAQEAYLRLVELQRCKFDLAAVEQHQSAAASATCSIQCERARSCQ